jgi:hypothetical protein
MSKTLPEHLRTDVRAGDLGEIQVHTRLKNNRGSCNFCNRTNYSVVHELSGSHLKVRLCNRCLQVVRKHKP